MSASPPAASAFELAAPGTAPAGPVAGSATDGAAAPVSGPIADLDAVLARALARSGDDGLPYHGDVTPAEAWALHRAGRARLVDVRTEAEWIYVGHVDGVPLVEWRAFGAQAPNARFIEQLRAQVPHDVPVMFLCRSGVRSQAAAEAAAAAGWRTALNVLEGFEGDLDDACRRGALGGWRKAGLPWVQT